MIEHTIYFVSYIIYLLTDPAECVLRIDPNIYDLAG